MRVDELNDETEARMDAIQDRIRALETQLAAAVKRAEEAEKRIRFGWERAAEKDRAYGEAIRQRDVARDSLREILEYNCGVAGGPLEDRYVLERAHAALSPSPVSALFPGVPLVPHEGPVTYEPKTTLPEPASGVAEEWGVDCSLCNRHWNQVKTREELDVRCARIGCPTRLPDPPTPAPGKDEATR